MTVKLSKLAMNDLNDIRDYTTKNWGRGQWLKYYRGMVAAFARIEERPDEGRDRSLFAEGMRSINYERHIIFYARLKSASDQPVVLRIVHQRRNLPALLYYEDLDRST